MDYKRENEEVEIDLLALIRFLWSKAVMLLLVTVIAAVAALAGTAVIGRASSTEYTSSTSIYVAHYIDSDYSFDFDAENSSMSKTSYTYGSDFVESCIYILQSRTTLEKIIEEVGLSCSWTELSGMISAEAVDDVYAFNVTVTGSSADNVLLIAEAVTKVLPGRISEVMDGADVSIVDYPTAVSNTPNYLKNTALGAFVGLFLCAAVLAVKYIIDEQNNKAVRSADELRYLFPDIPVLTLIPVVNGTENRSSYYSDKEANK